MKYLYILELCILLCYSTIANSTSLNMKNGKINVDEFLKTVIKSEKFDEIAEKIADKAVEKFKLIKGLDMSPASPNDFVNEATYRVSEVNVKELISSNPNHEVTGASDITKETTTHQYVIGKIDSAAFMKKESADSSKHVSLKYNQFTKSDYGSASRENDDLKVTDVEKVASSKELSNSKYLKGKIISDQIAEINKEKESNDDTITLQTKPENYQSTKFNEFSSKENDKTPTHQDIDSNQSSGENPTDSQNESENKSVQDSEKEDDYSKKLTPETKTSKDENKRESIEDSLETYSLNKEHLKDLESDAQYKKRKPVYEYLRLPGKREISNKGIENKIESTTLKLRIKDKIFIPLVKPKVSSKPDTDPKPVVRKEGNKLYTYEKSPDYQDYHMEISRIQNQLKTLKPVQ